MSMGINPDMIITGNKKSIMGVSTTSDGKTVISSEDLKPKKRQVRLLGQDALKILLPMDRKQRRAWYKVNWKRYLMGMSYQDFNMQIPKRLPIINPNKI